MSDETKLTDRFSIRPDTWHDDRYFLVGGPTVGAPVGTLAWGAHAKPDRVAAVLAALARAGRQPHALRTTAAGAPGHLLYLPASLTPIPWSPP